MSKSPLTQVTVPADSSNYTKGRTSKISEITIHHMAGVMTAEQCGKIFQKPKRNGSSHYGIGFDGKIGNYVDENNTAWTNSNWASNCRAITIETSNNKTGGDWTVSDKSLNSLIKLVADIAKRHNIKLVKGKTLTWHSIYASTICPGNYLRSKIDYIIDEANKINGGGGGGGDYTGVITYQAYTNKWLPPVNKCDNTNDGFAGQFGVAISGIKAKPQYGEITIQSHIKGGKWLSPISSKNFNSKGDNSYSGIYGKPIDGVKIKSSKGFVDYRVHIKNGKWLPWVNSKTSSGSESFAGLLGREIDGIQMK